MARVYQREDWAMHPTRQSGEWEGGETSGRAGWPLMLLVVPIVVLAAGGICWGHARVGIRRRSGPRG